MVRGSEKWTTGLYICPQSAVGKLCFQWITTPPSFLQHPELHTTLFIHTSGGTDPKCKTRGSSRTSWRQNSRHSNQHKSDQPSW